MDAGTVPAAGSMGRPLRTVYLSLKIEPRRSHAYIPARRLTVLGHEWQIDYHPDGCHPHGYHLGWVKLRLTLVSRPATDAVAVTASLTCRLVDLSQTRKPSQEVTKSRVFCCHGESMEVPVMPRSRVEALGFVNDNGNCFVQCAVAVPFDDASCYNDQQPLANVASTSNALFPSSDLHLDLGELLKSQKGTDVTFVVAGESFPAHRCVLAARSPVFKAEFLGGMLESAAAASRSVEIKEMDADTFGALLHFIYTDTLPQLEQIHRQETDEEEMAQRLLDAADRYGMQRLKMICEEKVRAGVGVETVAKALVLAERHGCAKLKARCMEFLVATPANLPAVAATEGYKDLEASCPSVLTELVMALSAGRYITSIHVINCMGLLGLPDS